MLIVFDDIIADMVSNKKLISVVIEVFIRGKLNISLAFLTQSHFKVLINVRLNSTHFILKIWNKQQLQQITFNNS